MEEEISEDVSLVVGQYINKRLDRQLKRGTGGLRDRRDAALIADYEANHTDRRAILYNGVHVASLSLSWEPATEQQTEQRLEVQDREAFASWVVDNPQTVAAWLADDPDAANALAGWALICTGEQPGGTGWREVITQYAQPARPKTRLTIKEDALEAALPELRAGVLGQLGAGQ